MAVNNYTLINKKGTTSRADYYDSRRERNSTGKNISSVPMTTTNVTNNNVTSTNEAVSNNTSNTSNNYQSALAQMYAQQQAQAAALQARQRAAAEAAYNAGMSRLNEAWNTKQGALKSNLSSTLSNLGRQYNSSKNEVTNDANKSLREAYVNYMLNKKNLNQNLTARGVGGGAAESTMAGMYNSYGNSRNDINTTLNDNLTSLEDTYQTNIASANQQYNSAYADALSQYMSAQSQMEQNLANSIVGSYGDMISSLGSLNSDYVNTLSKLLENQQSYEYMPTENTLGVDSATTTQENLLGTVTDYAKWLQFAQNYAKQGYSDEQIATILNKSGAGYDVVKQIFGL